MQYIQHTYDLVVGRESMNVLLPLLFFSFIRLSGVCQGESTGWSYATADLGEKCARRQGAPW